MCGVIGVIGQSPVIGDIVDGLLFLQHRGQDAAGAATFDGSTFRHVRAMGLVREVFDGVDLKYHTGHVGIGHVRYPTIGGGSVEDAQPFLVNSPFGIAMCHNGNLTNFKPLRKELQDKCRRHVGSQCDVEVILNVFADELARLTAGSTLPPDDPATIDAIFQAVTGTFLRCRGSYSVVAVIAGVGMLAFRDPYGIKPLIFGRKADGEGERSSDAIRDVEFARAAEPIAGAAAVRSGERGRAGAQARNGSHARNGRGGRNGDSHRNGDHGRGAMPATGVRWMVASESCALVSQGYRVERDVQPGEAILFRTGQAPLARQVTQGRPHLCIFEFIYFARPDSEIDGISVYKARMRLGSALARRWEEAEMADVDTVIPVPDSSRPAAQQMAAKMKKPFREGLLKNRYIGRTFIMPGDVNRKKGIRYKLSPVRLEIRNKRILLVDDSIVRGNTSRAIIQMVRETGSREVHMASSCPPLRFPCVYGVDMSTKREFIARDRTDDEVREAIGADSLLYQRQDDMVAACRPPNEEGERKFCMACMDGNYPTGDVTPEVLAEIEGERTTAGAGV